MHHDTATSRTIDYNSNSRRVVKNTRSQRIGYVAFDGQSGSVPCTIREFTEEGAVLSMNGWMGVPEEFPLFIEPDRVKVTCKVIRKRGSKVQVNFITWENDVRYRGR